MRALLAHLLGGVARGVLVDGDDLGVGERGLRVGVERADVGAHQQRRLQHRPQAEVRAVLDVARAGAHQQRAAAVEADDQHVEVVPVPGAGVLRELLALVQHVEHVEVVLLAQARVVEVVGDVLADAPLVHAEIGGPLGDVRPAAMARVIDDGPLRGDQRRGHAAHHALHLGLRRVLVRAAAVVLQVVDAPRREHRGVLGLVALAAGVARAGARAGAGVDAQLEAVGVRVVGEVPDAVRELGGVGLERLVLARGLVALPAVVEVHVDVAGVAQAVRHHRVHRLDDHLLVDRLAELVPAAPAHGRGLGQAVADGRGRRGGARRREERDNDGDADAMGHRRLSCGFG